MWVEIIITILAWTAICWGVINLYNIRKTKELIRRYNEEEDPGRRRPIAEGNDINKGTDRFNSTGKSSIQSDLEHAKRELLS